ncbi:GNAT family N-acetyltransferase [Pseudonocardia xinjiangensis]|uniref:GNAT family N-acetyltransferase n=1 Tax=Pseudonocardia xinjiangensis TaxID=75289 RepID=UPI003D8A6D94
MTDHLETDRLRLRRFTTADLDDVHALHSDPAVMRYLDRPATREHVRDTTLPQWFALYERHPRFGYFAALQKQTGTFLGWFLFRPQPVEQPTPGEIELGYRLHKAAWGRGFATEGSIALVEMGFTELGVQRVVATTMAVNRGSRRVLEKSGLRYVRTFHVDWPHPLDGSEHGEVEYALTREEWSRSPRRGTVLIRRRPGDQPG